MLNTKFLMHSSFLVELDNCFLLFDYFDGTNIPQFNKRIHLPDLSGKTIYAFASHAHKDHYSISLLELKKKYNDVHFILSKEIRLGDNHLIKHGFDPSIKDLVTFVKPGNDYQVSDAKISTLHSSDSGVAFIIDLEDKRIFHAGDLNWWSWNSMTDKERAYEEKLFKRCIEPIRGMHFDLAMVVQDPRLGAATKLGMNYFKEIASADIILPMHEWK